MNRTATTVAILICLLVSSATHAQIAGMRATDSDTHSALPTLDVDQANSHITIEGTAQVRVEPTMLRMIWAVTSEGKDAAQCHQATQDQIAKSLAALKEIGIQDADVHEDFISAIPRYEFLLQQQEPESVLKETQTGYRMQTNLHVSVKPGAQANQVIQTMFQSGVTDLIGVDYLADLKEARTEAMLKAIESAKQKADILLGALLDQKPQVINLQEQTQVYSPDQMYHSFENSANQTYYSGYRDNLRRILASRPQNTYYMGLKRHADDRNYQLPMKPQIIVESKVRLYYRSPSTRPLPTPK